MLWLPDDETLDLWATAARDADLDPATVQLFVAPPGRRDQYQALHFPPGMWPLPDDESLDFSGGLRERLYELKDEDVIVLADGKPRDLRLLLLRHEAEHVGQDRLCPAIGQVGVRLAEFFGDAYYGAAPHERDADAAATALRRALDIAASDDDLRSDNRKLYDAEWSPPDRPSLPMRLFAFSLFSPANFDLACRSSSSFPSVDPDALLEELLPGAAGVRADVGDRYQRAAEEAVAYDYDPEEWKRLPREDRNPVLDELRGRLVQQEELVIEEIGPLLA
jgi:hypothetical protein